MRSRISSSPGEARDARLEQRLAQSGPPRARSVGVDIVAPGPLRGKLGPLQATTGGPSSRRLVLALAPGVVLASVAGGIAFPILPSVGLRVGLSLPFIGLILAANRVARVFASPLAGMLTDRAGGRRTLLAGLLLQIVVMVLFVLGVRTSHAGALFLVGRVVHGVGSSFVFVAAQALALHAGGARHGGRAGSAVRTAMQIGVPIGLVAGGFVADLWGDAATFEAGAIALLLASIAASLSVPDLRVTAPPSEGHLRDTLRAFMDARLAAIGALSFASTFAGAGMVLTTTTLLVHARHMTVFALPERASASVLMGWLVLAEAIAMPPLGRLGDLRDAHAKIAAAGLLLTVPGLVLIALAGGPSTIAIGLGILGIGVGALGPSLLALVGRLVAPERRGLGVGALQVASDVGGSLGPLVGSALLGGSLVLPYLVTAGVNALLLPVAIWLIAAGARRRP